MLVEGLVSNLPFFLGRVRCVLALGWLVILRLRRVLDSLFLDGLMIVLVLLAGDLA